MGGLGEGYGLIILGMNLTKDESLVSFVGKRRRKVRMARRARKVLGSRRFIDNLLYH